MIIVGAKDETGKTTFTLFNKDIEWLLGILIELLVADISRVKFNFTRHSSII